MRYIAVILVTVAVVLTLTHNSDPVMSQHLRHARSLAKAVHVTNSGPKRLYFCVIHTQTQAQTKECLHNV